MAARKLGLLLSTAPSHPSVETVVQLAQAALRRGVEVYLYLIDEGVKSVTDQRYLGLIDAGVEDICLCLWLSAAWCSNGYCRFKGLFVWAGRAVWNY